VLGISKILELFLYWKSLGLSSQAVDRGEVGLFISPSWTGDGGGCMMAALDRSHAAQALLKVA
jgi:hypothetical protein